MTKEFSDTRESIERASKASGASEMLDELAKRMRSGQSSNGEQGRPSKTICEEFIKILDEPLSGRSFKKRMSFETVGGCTLIIHMPKRSKLFYHGSDYEIECSVPFKIQGLITTELFANSTSKGYQQVNTPDILKRLQGFKCVIINIHHHDGISIKSSHIHFKCENISENNLITLLKTLKEY
jgi:hypothetical protein